MNKLIEIALSQYGVKEITGASHNPTVVQYFREIGHSWVKNDETAWCSAFANWVVKQAGLKGSGRLDARSWLLVGEKTDTPQLGDIVVFWREKPTSWKGHVGFYIGHSENQSMIYTLGGNQDNMVCIHPYDSSRLLGYQRLSA